MLPYWTETYGNPSSLYGLGRRAGAALEDARVRIARVLNCQPAEIVFTGCGSESDNLALRGVGLAAAAKGKRHLITTPIEHHAVLHTAADLAERVTRARAVCGADCNAVHRESCARTVKYACAPSGPCHAVFSGISPPSRRELMHSSGWRRTRRDAT